MAYLIAIHPPNYFPPQLLSKSIFRIGRHPENDLVLADNSISRQHCEIHCLPDNTFKIIDLNSRNGTKINGQTIKTQILKSHDEIQIGNVHLIFHQLPSSEKLLYYPDLNASLSEGASWKSIAFGSEPSLDWNEIARRVDQLKPDDSKLLKPESRNFYLFQELCRIIILASSIEELLEVAMDGIKWALPFEIAGIFLRNPKNPNQLIPFILRGTNPDNPLVSSTILEYCAEKNLALLSTNVQTDPRLTRGDSIAQIGIHSALASPLWDGRENIGVVYLASLNPEVRYQESDFELLVAVSNLIALGIRQINLRSRLEKERLLRSHLERYHSPEVIDLILEQARDTGGKIPVTEKEVTILFADIKNFTSLSEKLTPTELAEILNGFFAYSAEIIFRHQGSLNKFLGDGLIAIFGAPLAISNHAKSAILAAQDLLTKTFEYCFTLNPSHRFQIKIGINTGVAIVGSFGTSQRMEYTALGDTVNIASRLQEIAEGGQILLSAKTQEMVSGLFPTRQVGQLKLRGKAEEITIFAIDNRSCSSISPIWRKLPRNP